jgi:hypothetical protein
LATYGAAFKLAAEIPATLAKSSAHVKGSYLFAYEWEPDDWDDLLACALAGGFDTVLFSVNMIFETTGHYAVNSTRWPSGLSQLATAVGVFKTAGLRVGVHCLAAGLGDTDSYVTPTPDSRLAVDATLTLASDLTDSAETVVTTATPSAWPANDAATGGATIWIDNELIQYTALDTVAPFGFTGCVRGYLGTTASAHTAGAAVKHVPRHASMLRYDANTTILAEIASAVATVMDACDFDMIYCDGMEGLQGGSHQHSYYASKIVEAIYAAQANADLLVQCSSVWHYSYHLESRHASADGIADFKTYIETRAATWTDTVLNLLPLDIGWYFIKSDCTATRDEWEYVLCKCIGYDASFSLELYATAYGVYGLLDDVLALVKAYEILRLADVVSDEMKALLRWDGVTRREYKLKNTDDVISFVRMIDGEEYPAETYVIAGAPSVDPPA